MPGVSSEMTMAQYVSMETVVSVSFGNILYHVSMVTDLPRGISNKITMVTVIVTVM